MDEVVVVKGEGFGKEGKYRGRGSAGGRRGVVNVSASARLAEVRRKREEKRVEGA